MDLVVDASVRFSAAIKDSATAELLLRDDLPLHAPEYLFDEFEKYRETLLERTHRSGHDFDRFVVILKGRISLASRDTFAAHEAQTRDISPDPGDVPYLALALSLDAPLWSDDEALQQQADVVVLRTADLIDRLDS